LGGFLLRAGKVELAPGISETRGARDESRATGFRGRRNGYAVEGALCGRR
jgi:hypothetical protein